MPLPFNDYTGNNFDPALLEEAAYKIKLIKLHTEIGAFQSEHGEREYLRALDNIIIKTLSKNEPDKQENMYGKRHRHPQQPVWWYADGMDRRSCGGICNRVLLHTQYGDPACG